jgi:D-alanyl-D-alanine carboxypeptidase (penicillin-binding protein 5/6)
VHRYLLTGLLILNINSAWASEDKYSETGATYDGTICVDADTGVVLSESTADRLGHPASVTKLMTFLLILEDARDQQLNLNSGVKITKEATQIGGSQVWLATGEEFTVKELLYALMLHSANDSAVALALTRAPTVKEFVERMNTRAKELGMINTHFVSPHGLTYGAGPHDTTTARDLAKLCVQLTTLKDAFTFTCCKEFTFRPGLKSVLLTNHNHLLNTYTGCDGFKTGWTIAANASIVTTARQNNHRVIAVVLGCDSPGGAKLAQRVRDQIAGKLMTKGFEKLALYEAEKAKLLASSHRDAPKDKTASSTPPPKTDSTDKKQDSGWLEGLFTF